MNKFEILFSDKDKQTFESIRQGKKRTESRAGTSPDAIKKYNFSNIEIGDCINFICDKESFSKTVVNVRKYKELDKFLENEDLEQIFGREITQSEAREIYMSFPNNYPERLKKYGIIAIELE